MSHLVAVPPASDGHSFESETIRSLIIRIVHRTLAGFVISRAFLEDAFRKSSQVKFGTWVGGAALLKLAVLDLKVGRGR